MRKVILQASLCVLSLFVTVSCKDVVRSESGISCNTITVDCSDRSLNQTYALVINGRQSVQVRPQVSGTISKVCIAEGAKVKQGQLLFIIDQIPYKAALETAIANVRSAEAAVATARLTVKSKEELYKERVISDFDVQKARNSLLEAEAGLARAKADETNARNNLSYTEVKSPVDGVASMLPYRIGALVSPTMEKPLVTVSDDKEVYAYFSMTENQILSLIEDNGSLDVAIGNMPAVELLLSNGKTYNYKGKIDAISGTIDSETGAISVRATFPNPEHILRNGSTGEVIVPHNINNALVIPQEATFEIQDKVFAYRVIDGKASSVQIKVYPINNGKEYIVENGLVKGDCIVAEGAGLIKEGAIVEAVK